MKTAADYPKLNLPSCRLRVAGRGGELCVWDSGRGRWLVLTPEEWVRRHILAMLTGQGYPAACIAQEHPIRVNGHTQRADIVVFGPDGRPSLLVECKAPDITIDRDTLDQAFRYNTHLGARRVMLTNGLDHFLYEVTPSGEYLPLKEFPDFYFSTEKA